MEAIRDVMLKSDKVDSAVQKSDSDVLEEDIIEKNVMEHRGPATLGEGDILLNRFMLMREIGKGGSCRVYRARDLLAVLGGNLQESDIAIKVADFNAPTATGCEQELLLREALSTRHLSHPNILKIYDYHRDGDVVFVAMELVEGESLAEFVNHYPDKTLSYKQLIAIIDPVVGGLSVAHKRNIVHSDIKPANILLSEGGEVKIIDFATSRKKITHSKAPDPHCLPGFMAYTEAYASPGLLRDEPPSVSDDIYSLACVIFELLSGSKAKVISKTGDSDDSHLVVAPQKPIKPISLNMYQWRILRNAMADNGYKRFLTVDDFWRKFTRARFVYIQLLLGFLFLVGSSGLMLTGLGKEIIGKIDVSYNRQIVGATNLSSLDAEYKLEEMDIPGRLAYLQELKTNKNLSENKIDEIKYKHYSTIINWLSNKVSLVMEYDASSYSLPDFDGILGLIEVSRNIYPDSLKLSNLDKILKEEKEQFVGFLLNEYRNLWQDVDYNIGSAFKINAILKSLRSVPIASGVINDSAAIENLHGSMLIAIHTGDFVRFSQLYRFSEIITAHENLQLSMLAFDPALYLAANNLIAYSQTDKFSTYPERDAALWASPSIKELEGRIEKVWLDSEMENIRKEIVKLYADYQAPTDADFLRPLIDALFKKLIVKIQYHKSKGNKSSHERLQSVYQKMVAAYGGGLVGEGID